MQLHACRRARIAALVCVRACVRWSLAVFDGAESMSTVVPALLRPLVSPSPVGWGPRAATQRTAYPGVHARSVDRAAVRGGRHAEHVRRVLREPCLEGAVPALPELRARACRAGVARVRASSGLLVGVAG